MGGARKADRTARPCVLVTGAAGYVGALLLDRLYERRDLLSGLVALDVREIPAERRRTGVRYAAMDVRAPEIADVFKEHAVDVVVHLATIVTPGKKSDRAFERSVDVGGTRNVLSACLAAGVRKLVVTSSGAAYGYHADNPAWLTETDALRGNPEFAYSDHKRQVEEMLADARRDHPELAQLVLRPCTILGETSANQITALFEKRFVLGITGASTPFVFVWDGDVVECLAEGVVRDVTGAYNVAGDGTLTMREIAGLLGKPYLPLPVGLLGSALSVLKRLGLTRYGPEQVDFLRYRPVLSNERLKREFGYTPRLSSREAFDLYRDAANARKRKGMPS